MANPGEKHFEALMQLFHYAIEHGHTGLIYKTWVGKYKVTVMHDDNIDHAANVEACSGITLFPSYNNGKLFGGYKFGTSPGRHQHSAYDDLAVDDTVSGIDGGDWKLVRSLSQTHGSWHPASDRLHGEDVYHIDKDTWSKQFNHFQA